MKAAMTVCLAFLFVCCNPIQKKEDHHLISVKKSPHPLTIDGKATENIWAQTDWHALDQNWLGKPYEHDDFNGKYKLSWDEDGLYILVEVTDDVLYDQYKDPLKLWWNDDCMEVFIDEDNSGGLQEMGEVDGVAGATLKWDEGKGYPIEVDHEDPSKQALLDFRESVANNTEALPVPMSLRNIVAA